MSEKPHVIYTCTDSLYRARNSSISHCKSDFFRASFNIQAVPINLTCTNGAVYECIRTETTVLFQREAIRVPCTDVVATRFLPYGLIERQETMYCDPRWMFRRIRFAFRSRSNFSVLLTSCMEFFYETVRVPRFVSTFLVFARNAIVAVYM